MVDFNIPIKGYIKLIKDLKEELTEINCLIGLGIVFSLR